MKPPPLIGYFLDRLMAQRFLWLFAAMLITVIGISVLMMAGASMIGPSLPPELLREAHVQGLKYMEGIVSFFGMVLAVLLGAYAASALKSPDMEPILVKRLSRDQVFAFGYASHFLVILAYWFLFYSALFILLLVYDAPLSWEFVMGVGFRLLSFTVIFLGIAGLGLWLPLPGAFGAVMIFVFYSFVTGMATQITSFTPIKKLLIHVPFLVVPKLSAFDLLDNALVQGTAANAQTLAANALYGLLWCAVLVLAALFLYRRREMAAG